jgi:RimJ/RimL family protein N-acetyltransferase
MKLREAIFNDWKLLLDWRNDIETRRNSHNMELVEEESHKKWINSILSDKNRHIFIALENNTPIGTVRADFNEQMDEFELSWTISPDFRGKGLGNKMVRLVADRFQTKLRAEIKKGNVPSIKIAEFAGLKYMREENGILHYSNY